MLDDVANLLLWEDLRDIVLVGHSYGGIVVRHVADRLPDRVRSLVYLDAFIPEDGKSLVDHLPDSGKRHREQAQPRAMAGRFRRPRRQFSRSMRRMPPGWTASARCTRLRCD